MFISTETLREIRNRIKYADDEIWEAYKTKESNEVDPLIRFAIRDLEEAVRILKNMRMKGYQ